MGGLNLTDRLKANNIDAKKASMPRVALSAFVIKRTGPTAHPRAHLPVDRALVDHIKAHGVPVEGRRFKAREDGDRLEVIDGCRRTMAGLAAEKELQREAPRLPPLEWDRADPHDPGRLYVETEVVICSDVELVLMRLDANVSRGLPDSKSVLAAIVTSLIKLNRNVMPEGDLMARLVAAMPRGVGASEIVALSMWENLDAELRTALDHPDVPIGLLVPITKARAEDRPALFQKLMRDGVRTAKGATRRANKGARRARPVGPQDDATHLVASGQDHRGDGDGRRRLRGRGCRRAQARKPQGQGRGEASRRDADEGRGRHPRSSRGQEVALLTVCTSACIMACMSDAKLSPHDERRVAVEAGCDPRTVKAYLAGKPTRSTMRGRLEATLKRLGFGALVQTPKQDGAP